MDLSALVQKWRDMEPRKALVWMAAVCGFVASLFGIKWLVTNWNSPDRHEQLVNFFAAWYPFALSILLQFVPDQQFNRRRKVIWRGCVIAVGIIFSFLLWHQQSMQAENNRKDRETSMKRANEHSDEKFKGLETSLRNEIQSSGSSNEKQLNGLKTEVGQGYDSLGKLFSETRNDLTKRIDSVGKPDPPETVKIQFGFESSTVGDFPVVAKSVKRNPDGTVTIGFMVRNVSGVQAKGLELWTQVCQGCSYTKEPLEYKIEAGSDPHVRHRFFGVLNPKVFINPTQLDITIPAVAPSVDVSFAYACENCGPVEGWTSTLRAIVAP